MSDREDQALEAQVRAELAKIEDPAGAGDLVTQGRIGSVEISPDEVLVVLRLDQSWSAEQRTALEDRVRGVVAGLSHGRDCMIDVETPAKGQAQAAAHGHGHGHDHGDGHGHGNGHDHGHGHGQEAPRPAALAGVGKVLAVASGKGGVGKSTVAINLALALAARGLKVGLLDADMHGPSFPTLLGLDSVQPKARNGKVEPIQIHGLQVMSLGFLLDPDQPVIWRGPMITGAIRQLLQDVLWENLDVLVVDLPPGTGDAQLTLVQTAKVDQAVIVTTPSDLALSDARRGLLMFRQVEVPVLGIVENMSHFLCPHCGERSDVFGAGGGRRTAETLGVPFLVEIPLDLRIGEGNDRGRPVVLDAPESPSGRIFAELAGKAADKLGLAGPPSDGARPEGEDQRRGLLSSLFGKK